ncbi:MAG: hypothetical protein U0X41_03745 [Chitinophagales bacterium]
MNKIKNILFSLLILIVASFSIIDEDLLKFLLSGQSGTYNVSLVRYNYMIVFVISLLAIFFLFHLKRNNIFKYLFGISLQLLFLSLRTFAIVNNHKTVLISGYAIFPISECEVTANDSCPVKFDFLIKDEIKRAIKSAEQ